MQSKTGCVRLYFAQTSGFTCVKIISKESYWNNCNTCYTDIVNVSGFLTLSVQYTMQMLSQKMLIIANVPSFCDTAISTSTTSI